MSDNRVYSYSAVLMGSPILLKLCSHDGLPRFPAYQAL